MHFAARGQLRKVQEIRDRSYEKIKRNLLLTLLELEKVLPEGRCIGAGRCGLCRECTRSEGRGCRYPEMRRYSIAAVGFDCGAMMKEQLDMELIWSKDGGLPEYDVAWRRCLHVNKRKNTIPGFLDRLLQMVGKAGYLFRKTL